MNNLKGRITDDAKAPRPRPLLTLLSSLFRFFSVLPFTNPSLRSPRSLRLMPLLLFAVAIALTTTTPSQADQKSTKLEKYEKPIDEATDKALAFLAKKQQKDGCWLAGGDRRDLTGITSLCLMAFLAKGNTPGDGPYGDVIDKGVDFVLAGQLPNGLIAAQGGHGAMYDHCISTLLLSEVSGMVDQKRQEKLDKVLGKALKVIISAQDEPKDPSQTGGWRYQINSNDSDLSCTSWAVMSLRSVRNAGCHIPRGAIEKALGFIMRCRTQDGGFAYQPGGPPGLGRTGTAILCLELMGQHRSRATLAGGDWIKRHFPNGWGQGEFFNYAMYYASQGMFQLGDDYWEDYAVKMYELMLKNQKADGHWDGTDQAAGESYGTAMAVLAMSVSYRQLPIYQR